MRMRKLSRGVAAVAILALATTACSSDDDASEAPAASETAADEMSEPMDEMSEPMDEDTEAAPADSTEICDADSIVAAVEGGAEEGTLAGMSDDPVATAASNNPVLTTLVTAVTAAELGDTLNGAEALTVFAPTDCAFAAVDPATLQAALDDPSGLLTTVLGFHVVVGQQLSAEDLAGMTEIETFTGETLTIEASGDSLTVGGQAGVVVGDIMTSNATVHLIDSVMLPPSVTG